MKYQIAPIALPVLPCFVVLFVIALAMSYS
jgi:hypothetical protein